MDPGFCGTGQNPPPPQTFPAWVFQQPTELSRLEPESRQNFKRAVTCPFSSIITERLSAPALASAAHLGFPLCAEWEGPGLGARALARALLLIEPQPLPLEHKAFSPGTADQFR